MNFDFDFLNGHVANLLPFGLLAALALAAYLILTICRRYLVRLARMITQKIPIIWIRDTLDDRLLTSLTTAIPIVLVLAGVNTIPDLKPDVIVIVERICHVFLIFVGLRALSILLWNINQYYSTLEISRDRPIKGLIQVSLIILHLFAFILSISILLNKSPWIFLSGLGAMTAVLLLIFRDTLLSLVAGFQLTTNNFIRVGDWIEMPQFGADGDVIDISLHAVRVQNWDKTITVIPTHKFLEHSFKNWRGMSESGGRRIKRAIFVDMSTIRFLKEDEIQRYSRFVLLRDYIAEKVKELQTHNQQFANDPNLIVNSRRLTNIGTFRAYLMAYLRQHPRVHQGMTILVRQLAPTAEGLPLEIYVFSKDTRWVHYETLQADIFDHILAIAKEFDLRVFQNPTGHDFNNWLERQDSKNT